MFWHSTFSVVLNLVGDESSYLPCYPLSFVRDIFLQALHTKNMSNILDSV